MTTFRNILLTTDFSDSADAGLPYAVELTKQGGGTLHIIHVFEDDATAALISGVVVGASAWLLDLRKKFEHRLEFLARELEHAHGIKVVWTLVPGHPVSAIIEYIKRSGVDLTVLATHGRTALAHVLIGSVAERVVRLSPSPVLTIRPIGKGVNGVLNFKRILLSTDFSSNAEAVWPYASALAEQQKSTLVLTHVIEPSVYYANAAMSDGMGVDVEQWLIEIRKSAETALARSAEKLRSFSGRPVETLLREGRAADQLVEAARDKAADLVMISTHGFTGFSHAMFGSVAERVVRFSPVPVLSIRPTQK